MKHSQSDGSTILIINVCAFFFENFHCITVLIICKNFWNHQKKTFDPDQKKILRLFFKNDHVTVYIQEIKLAKIVLVFSKSTLTPTCTRYPTPPPARECFRTHTYLGCPSLISTNKNNGWVVPKFLGGL
jgi:hypothetical protein